MSDESTWHDFAPTTEIDGTTYFTTQGLMIEHRNGHTSYYVPGQMMPKDTCDCCGRSDWVARVAYSVEQAVEYGLLVPRV